MHSTKLETNKQAWQMLLVAFILLVFAALGSLFNRGIVAAQQNILPLSLAFNDLESGLQTFLTSRRMEGFKNLKAERDKFDELLKNIKQTGSEGAFSFLPFNISGFISASDLSSFDFTKLNQQWGITKNRVDGIIEHADAFNKLQQNINNTQEKNKIMQEHYKNLISFLVDNYFSGNKIAIIQRQPWLADRVSLRLLWLQRPLAFSAKSIDVLKQEADLFHQSSTTLLNQQLGEIAGESEELAAILQALNLAIAAYTKDVNSVVDAGNNISQLKLDRLIYQNNIENVDASLSEIVREIFDQANYLLLSPGLINLAFLLGLVLSAVGAYKLRKTWTSMVVAEMAQLETQRNMENAEVSTAAFAETPKQLIDSQLDELTYANEIVAQTPSMEAADTYPEIADASKFAAQNIAQDAQFDKLLHDLQQIQNGNLSVELDAQHEIWGGIAERVNMLVATMRQLVKAVSISAEQTSMIADKRHAFSKWDNTHAYDVQQQAHIVLERVKILDLNLKIKLGGNLFDERAALLLSNDVQKLKVACEKLQHELTLTLGADLNEEHAIQSKLFDNLQELSVKLKGIAARFEQA